MKQGVQMNLPNVGSNDTLEAGRVSVDEDKIAPYLECKVMVTLKNNGGGVYAFNDADKQGFLSGYKLHGWDGAQQKRKWLDGKTLDVLDAFSRFLGGSEWQGYSDSTNGLAYNFAAAEQKDLVLWARIPTGQCWFLPELNDKVGIGHLQAKTVKIKSERIADTLPANFTVIGTVKIEVRPGEKPAHGRQTYSYFPEMMEIDEARERATIEGGVFLGAFEMTNPKTSSTLSDIRVSVGKTVIHDGVPAYPDCSVDYLESINLPSAADLSDRYTPIYVQKLGTPLRDFPPGNVSMLQIKKDMGTVKFLGYYFPRPTYEQVKKDVTFLGGELAANRPIKAINGAELLGITELPDALRCACPMVIVDQASPYFDTYPGLIASPTRDAYEDVPPTVTQRAKGQLKAHSGNGDHVSHEAVIRRVAAQIPGSVQSAAGFDGGDSPALAHVRAVLG